MGNRVSVSLLAALLSVPQGTRPVEAWGGSPIFGAFFATEDSPRLEKALGYFPAELQQQIRERVATTRTNRSRLAIPSGIGWAMEQVWERRRRTEIGLVRLAGRPGIEQEALEFAKAAPLAYEWEGYLYGPVAETRFAAKYLREHPQTGLASAIDLFLLDEYRCAFEAAGRTVKEFTEPRRKEEVRAIQRAAAADYLVVWQRLQKNSDVVIRAVAEDIDEQAYLYSRGEGHPRTFKE